MPVEFKELFEKIQIVEAGEDAVVREISEDPTAEIKYLIKGAEDASTAYTALYNYLSENKSDLVEIAAFGIPLKSVRISTTENKKIYSAECSFAYNRKSANDVTEMPTPSDAAKPDIQDKELSFTTAGGTTHITRSYFTRATSLNGGDVYDFNGGINWNGQGFDGVDIVCPHAEFTISRSLPKSYLNVKTRVSFANITGFINKAEWMGFDAHCVMFKGLTAKTQYFSYTNAETGQDEKDWYWRIDFSFEARPQQKIFALDQTTLLDSAGGFDYVWTITQQQVVSDGGVGTVPVQVNVEFVYPDIEFYYYFGSMYAAQ